MATMICSICGKYGIYWKNLSGLSPYTYCPNCGNTNCQRWRKDGVEEGEPQEDEENYDCSDAVTGCGDK
jgi:hypothetical protein